MKPCLNPQICGVKQHYPGTECKPVSTHTAQALGAIPYPVIDEKHHIRAAADKFRDSEMGENYSEDYLSFNDEGTVFVLKADVDHDAGNFMFSVVRSGQYVWRRSDKGQRPEVIRISNESPEELEEKGRKATHDMALLVADKVLISKVGRNYDHKSLKLRDKSAAFMMTAIKDHEVTAPNGETYQVAAGTSITWNGWGEMQGPSAD